MQAQHQPAAALATSTVAQTHITLPPVTAGAQTGSLTAAIANSGGLTAAVAGVPVGYGGSGVSTQVATPAAPPAPPAPLDYKGVVCYVDDTSQFGFVMSNSTTEKYGASRIFIHKTRIQGTLEVGLAVAFSVIIDEKQKTAVSRAEVIADPDEAVQIKKENDCEHLDEAVHTGWVAPSVMHIRSKEMEINPSYNSNRGVYIPKSRSDGLMALMKVTFQLELDNRGSLQARNISVVPGSSPDDCPFDFNEIADGGKKGKDKGKGKGKSQCKESDGASGPSPPADLSSMITPQIILPASLGKWTQQPDQSQPESWGGGGDARNGAAHDWSTGSGTKDWSNTTSDWQSGNSWSSWSGKNDWNSWSNGNGTDWSSGGEQSKWNSGDRSDVGNSWRSSEGNDWAGANSSGGTGGGDWNCSGKVSGGKNSFGGKGMGGNGWGGKGGGNYSGGNGVKGYSPY
eukprot:gnl/MRDRNA2_/MRDRNA2_85330_c0_seq3.p1 gnl/MRDRNA2_/MRDRNA2_85330_c0~~gnl/MRDRNA2_/MRDRNA2_85330_c0_seq3.p1  ORF type:complete len:490 (+),score=121.82 gnl/MRDRNA2_/MRDRNA2_85330_c0_seq3:106-1470(+)